MTLQEFIKEYLRVNKSISYDTAHRLHGCTYSGFTGRISELRNMGWEIPQDGGVYTLESEPLGKDTTPEMMISIPVASIQELVSMASTLEKSLEDILH